jgi:hypothetical protein
MGAIVKSVKQRLESFRKHAAVLREKAKQTTHAVVQVGAGAVTAGAVGALDQSKGVSKPNDMGVTQHYVGPVPTSALIGGVGIVGALMMNIDSMESKMLLGVGQGGIDSAAYVMGKRLWIKHQQGSK